MNKKLTDALHDIRTCDATRALAKAADRNTANITHHNYRHFISASRRAAGLARQLETLYPGTFKPEHIAFHAPLAAFGHDFERSVKPGTPLPRCLPRNAHWSAVILSEMMTDRGVPTRDQQIVLYAVCNHSAGPSRKALRYQADTDELLHEQRLILATTVFGDKSDSTRRRVRSGIMQSMEQLVEKGAFKRYFAREADENSKNWLANFALLRSELIVDPRDNGGNPRYKGSIILQWTFDERLCSDDPERSISVGDILSVKWFAKGQHGCENAAQNVFGLNYGVEANGKRWFFNKERKLWLPQTRRQADKTAA